MTFERTTKHGTFTIEIDDEDAYKLIGKAVYVVYRPRRKRAYAMVIVDGKAEYLNRYLFSVDKCEKIEFIDGNTLNNKKSNLKIVSGTNKRQGFRMVRIDNYTGVYASRDKKRFYAQIISEDKKMNYGPFFSEAEAIRAFEQKNT